MTAFGKDGGRPIGPPRLSQRGLHRGGEGSLDDLGWTERPEDRAHADAESKPHLVALAFAIAERWR